MRNSRLLLHLAVIIDNRSLTYGEKARNPDKAIRLVRSLISRRRASSGIPEPKARVSTGIRGYDLLEQDSIKILL